MELQNKGTKYFQFRLSLIRNLFIDKQKTLNNIITDGIYYKSNLKRNEDPDKFDVCRQILYDYYRQPEKLTTYLKSKISYYMNRGQITEDTDYNGFTAGGEFCPNINSDELLQVFETDMEFRNRAFEYLRTHQAMSFFNLSGNTGYLSELKPDDSEKEPRPMISKDLVFDYRDNQKTEVELIQLAAYIAIHSILGKKSYCKTNKPHILVRMFGYSGTKHSPDELPPMVKELFNKYSSRYWMDKVLLYMQLSWKIILYDNHSHGIFIGNANKISIDSLVLAAETIRKKNKIEFLKKQKQQAKDKALLQLY